MPPISAIRKAAQKRPNDPVWAGPCGEGPQGGVTQSLLTRYLSCKERFRILAVEGLKPAERFNPALDYGNMWHACEEALAAGWSHADQCPPVLFEYEEKLAKRFPLQRQEIAEWAGKCAMMFPRYHEHWAKHPDVKDRTPLLQEAPFDVPYNLPSGRVVRLRGKFDSVDLIGKGKDVGMWLQENKTKGTIDGVKINRQLTFDLQTMLYLIALRSEYDKMGWAAKGPICGVRYNVVRRPAHKIVANMLKTFEADKAKGAIGEWFVRWRVEVSAADVAKFKREALDPILENLCDDYEWWSLCKRGGRSPFDDNSERHADSCEAHYPRHFRMPYTGYNPLAEGGFGDVDEYMATGSTVGLVRVEEMFPELTGAA